MRTEEAKAALRREARRMAAELTEVYRQNADRAIAEAVRALPEYRRAKTVFVYVGMPGEPDTAGLIEDALRAGKRVCAPRCKKRPDMDAAVIESAADLRPGVLGIPAPGPEAPAVPLEEIDLALIPCVAAGRDGSRLGHGAGYYDVFLAGNAMTKVCLCFEQLLWDTVPMDAHDCFMDAVVTEKKVYLSHPNR